MSCLGMGELLIPLFSNDKYALIPRVSCLTAKLCVVNASQGKRGKREYYKLPSYNQTILLHWLKCRMRGHRGVATNFRLGGRILTGGTVSGELKPATRKFRFLLGFRPLYLGNIEKFKSYKKYSENFFKSRDFWGTSPGISNRGDTFPASPPPPLPRWRRPCEFILQLNQWLEGTMKCM